VGTFHSQGGNFVPKPTAVGALKKSSFAKNIAHNERRFKINAYLCSILNVIM
jgi:hypothetical protein